MRADLLNTSSGQLSLTDSGANRCLKQTVAFTDSSATISSGAITLPEDALIVRLTAVCTILATYPSGTLGIRCGTAAAGVQLIIDDDNGLETTSTTLAKGLGCSTYAELNTALSGQAAHVIVAGAALQDAGTEVHFQIASSAGAFTTGEFCFIVEYIPVKDNV